MKQVKIYRMIDGKQKEVVVCQTDENGVLTFSGEAEYMINDFVKNGITDYSVKPHRVVMPEEADKFLEQLSRNFRTIYTLATEPMNL
jgi:hypothetical protein